MIQGTSGRPGGMAPQSARPEWVRAVVLSMVASSVAVLAGAALALAFGLAYAPRGMLMDALLLWPPALLVLWATGSYPRTQGVLLLVAGLLVGGQAISLAALGAPLRLTDLLAVPTLLSVMDRAQKVYTGVGIAVAVLLLAWLLRARWRRVPVLLAGLLLLGTAFVPGGWGQRLALRVLPAESADPATHVARGGGVASLLAANAGRQVVDIETVASIVGDTAWSAGYEGPRRNIHFVLLETFWDPLRLKAYQFSEDPFDPRFREMVEQSQGSMALTPHFGHLTANAEFESLCGLQASEDKADFVATMSRHAVPCLPRVLQLLGYRTIASHPNNVTSWGRDKAYGLVGFERFNSSQAFEIDDTDALFLNDASLYRQNLAMLEEEGDGRPVFNYVVSISSHWPYRRNTERRPDVVSLSPDDELLRAYVNGLRYSSAAFVAWADEVLRRDPEALIVAYGDHSPSLPPGQVPFRKSGYPVSQPARLTDQQLLELAGTPLLVIDGRRGVVPVGVVPVTALPDLVLRMAFGGQVALPQTRALQTVAGAELRVRRYLGRLLADDGSGWRSCDGDRAAEPVCQRAARMQWASETLRQDLTEGDAHFNRLARLPAPLLAHAPMELGRAGCALEVEKFGPRDLVLGEGFNVQKKSGNSAFWFHLKRRVGAPRIRVGTDEAPLDMHGLFGAAGWRSPAFVHEPGEHVVYVVCDGQEDRPIGTVFVRGPSTPPAARAAAGKEWSDAELGQTLDLVRRSAQDFPEGTLVARTAGELCATSGWRGPLVLEWSVPGSRQVSFFVRSSDADQYKLWARGGGSGTARTGDWAHDRLQIRAEVDGGGWAEFTVNSAACMAEQAAGT